MENSSTTPTGNPNLIVPPGTASPKVFDLSSMNNLNSPSDGNIFKKKPFIFGIIGIFILVATLGAGTYYSFVLNKTNNTNSKAAECWVWDRDQSFSVGGENTKTAMKGTFTNNCSTEQKVYAYKFWCAGIINEGANPHTQPKGRCSENKNEQIIKVAPGKSTTISLEQQVGNTGNCGSAQVDVSTGRNGTGANLGGMASYSANGECAQIKCTRIDQTPPDTRIIPGEKIKLTNSTSGSTGTWESTWSVTSDGANKGTFQNINYNGTFWTAPATLNASQTWTFNVTVKDKNGSIDNTGCTSTVSFTTAPQTYTHKVCNADKACVSVACNPATTDCSSSTDCKTADDCKTTTYKFNTCENNSCVSKDCPNPNVSCSQSDDCKNDNDCKSTPSHKVCQNNACVTIDGAGTDNCTSDSACQSNPTHKTCQNNSCVTVDGAGSDSCSSDPMCQPEATPPPIPESGSTLMTVGTIIVGAIAILGGVFLAM